VEAARALDARGIDVEVIDLRSIKPWDEELVFESVRKTSRLLIVDGAWKTCGVSAEIAAAASEHVFEHLSAPIVRLALPDAPAPMSKPLEHAYYINSSHIVDAVGRMVTPRRRVVALSR